MARSVADYLRMRGRCKCLSGRHRLGSSEPFANVGVEAAGLLEVGLGPAFLPTSLKSEATQVERLGVARLQPDGLRQVPDGRLVRALVEVDVAAQDQRGGGGILAHDLVQVSEGAFEVLPVE